MRTALKLTALTMVVIALGFATTGANPTNLHAASAEGKDRGIEITIYPQQTEDATPTPVPFRPGDARLHTTRSTMEAGKSTIITLAATNPKDNPVVTATVSLKIPDGATVAQQSGSGWASEHCKVQCTAEIRLEPGHSNEENSVEVTAETHGSYTVGANVAWTTEGNHDVQETTAEQTLTVTARDQSAVTSPVNLHATVTEAVEGEPINVTLSMINSIANEAMTAQAILEVPPGLSVSSAEFAKACTPRCNVSHTLNPGENKAIIINVIANEPGEFSLKGKMEWYYGNSAGDRGKDEQEITLTAKKRPATPVATIPGAGQLQQTPAPEEVEGWNTSEIIAGVVILGIGALALYKKVIEPLLKR